MSIDLLDFGLDRRGESYLGGTTFVQRCLSNAASFVRIVTV